MDFYLVTILIVLGSGLSTVVSGQCDNCTDYGYCMELDENGACLECSCPINFSGDCCEGLAPPTTCDDNPCGATSNKHFHCENLNLGLYLCSCEAGFKGSNCDQTVDPCNPNPCANSGTCSKNGNNNNFTCACSSSYEGRICQNLKVCYNNKYDGDDKYCDCPDFPCENNQTCIDHKNINSFDCQCSQNYTGNTCQTEPCGVNPCKHGGFCYTKADKSRQCICLSIWTGWYCTDFNICGTEDGQDACLNGGTCVAVDGGVNMTCACVSGWEGEFCENMTNNCDPDPCWYNSTCTNKFNDYDCDCVLGTEGKNCSTNPNDCDLGWSKTPCNTVDKNANCTDGFGSYTCVCSPDYTATKCTMSMIVYNVIGAGGDVSIIDLLEDVVQQPSMIKDLLPFLLGQMSAENQSLMSWEADDLFVWAAYEKTELDVNVDLVKWYDVNLGNCFTFNHVDANQSFGFRYPGNHQGFKTLMRVRQDEYLAWIDTASLLVFIHTADETVFAESVRYQAAPNTSISVMTSKVSYKRLNGKYGNCVHDKAEVQSYYYSGVYTTAGCLRSCYQDVVFASCDCFDPRYAMPDPSGSCGLDKWNCVQNVTTVKGDASNWEECECPAPCQESQFTSSYDLSWFQEEPADCTPTSASFGDCMKAYQDMALITVYLPRMSQKTFVESPKMSMNQMISYTGGMAGVFTGLCIITIIDVIFLLIHLCGSVWFGKNYRFYGTAEDR